MWQKANKSVILGIKRVETVHGYLMNNSINNAWYDCSKTQGVPFQRYWTWCQAEFWVSVLWYFNWNVASVSAVKLKRVYWARCSMRSESGSKALKFKNSGNIRSMADALKWLLYENGTTFLLTFYEMKITAYFEAFGNVERVQYRHINSETRFSSEKTNVKSPQWKAAYSVIYRTYQEKPQHFYLVKFHVNLLSFLSCWEL